MNGWTVRNEKEQASAQADDLIAAIDLLESFVGIGSVNKIDLEWRIAILATFVVAGILLVWVGRLANEPRR
jgi:hypothetical protein